MAEAEGESCNDTSQCVIVMRHGARLDTADPSWERTTDRPYDTPITGKGKIEAYKVASKRCAGRDIKKVISSPFLRCLQTAQAVCNATSIKGIITNNSLCEIMTPGAKMKSAPIVPAQDIDSYDITVLEYDHHPLPNYPETLNEALERYQVAIKSIADEHYPDNLILVTHQYGVEQALTVGLGLEHSLMYEVVYCGSIELVREERDGPWRVVSKDRIYQYDNVM